MVSSSACVVHDVHIAVLAAPGPVISPVSLKFIAPVLLQHMLSIPVRLYLLLSLVNSPPQQMLHIINQINLLAQLDLHIVHYAVNAVPVQLAVVQGLGGDVQRRRGGVQRPVGTPLLLVEKVSLVDYVFDLTLQLRLPEVDVVQALGKLLGAQSLCAVCGCLGLFGDTIRLPAVLL